MLNMVLPVNLSVHGTCYGELTAEVDSRLPAVCRGNTGEADDAEPESLDSGPQVLLNLLRACSHAAFFKFSFFQEQ